MARTIVPAGIYLGPGNWPRDAPLGHPWSRQCNGKPSTLCGPVPGGDVSMSVSGPVSGCAVDRARWGRQRKRHSLAVRYWHCKCFPIQPDPVHLGSNTARSSPIRMLQHRCTCARTRACLLGPAREWQPAPAFFTSTASCPCACSRASALGVHVFVAVSTFVLTRGARGGVAKTPRQPSPCTAKEHDSVPVLVYGRLLPIA